MDACSVLFEKGRIFSSPLQLKQVATLFLDKWGVQCAKHGKKIVFYYHALMVKKEKEDKLISNRKVYKVKESQKSLVKCPFEIRYSLIECVVSDKVHAPNESITGQLRKSLFDSASRPIIISYLRDRYRWTPQTFDSIDWKAHAAAIRSLSIPKHRFVTKFIHRILPIGARLRQRQAHMPANCPSCEAILEDDWHWLACPQHQLWRDKQARLLARRLRTLHTEPGLTNIAMRAFRELTHTGECSFEGSTLTEAEQTVTNSQSTIGWTHFLFGRLSEEWTIAQRNYIVTEGQNAEKYSGHAWTAKLITHLWRAILAHWSTRNEALHGPTAQSTTKRAGIEPLIRQLYARQHELPAYDQAMFLKPLETRLQQPLSVLSVWLSVATPAFQAARIDPDDSSVDDDSTEPPASCYDDHEPPD
jgi:hypothetical protein